MNSDYDRTRSVTPEGIFQYTKPYNNDTQKNNPPIFDSKSSADYLVSFLTQPISYCIGIVDMVNSTRISAQIGSIKSSRYYQVFLNSMSKIISEFPVYLVS